MNQENLAITNYIILNKIKIVYLIKKIDLILICIYCSLTTKFFLKNELTLL